MTTNPTICPLVELLAAVRTPPPAAAPQPAPAAPPASLAPAPADGPARLLWTTTEAAARLSIGRSKLYGLMRNDLLPSVLLGGRRLIAEQDLVELVDRLRGGWEPWG